MKKLLIIITLFVSSFFLFCNKEVKADITITESDISTYITEDFLLSREYLISKKMPYVVIYEGGSYLYFNNSSSSFTLSSTTIKVTSGTWIRWNGSSFSSVTSNYNNSYFLSSAKIIDSSFDLFPTKKFNVIYNNKTYLVGPDNKFVTVYDIYNEINSVPTEPEEPEELKVVSNFYTSVIDRISYLSEQIASNYVFLSILVIFIIIFIFLLIFRRFLW